MSIRIIIADDHPLIISALNRLFRREKDFQVIANCSNGIEAIEALKSHRPDIAILDIQMPGKNGIEIVREMAGLPTRVVILTGQLDDKDLLEAVHLGVKGIVLKDTDPKLLIQCIREVHAGGQWLEHRAAMHTMEMIMQKEESSRTFAALLTVREIEIAQMVAKGLRNKNIGEKLFISEGTVKTHLHNIYEKLNVNSRLALLRHMEGKELK
jgi:DNA-binding NarL/FixJ family response regulator